MDPSTYRTMEGNMGREPNEVRMEAKRVRRNASGHSADSGSSSGDNRDAFRPAKRSERDASLYRLLSELCERDDGYLRIIPDGAGKSCFYKWKFTRGEHAGYYVMAVVEYWQVDYGVTLLMQKITSVVVGASKPVKDTKVDN